MISSPRYAARKAAVASLDASRVQGGPRKSGVPGGPYASVLGGATAVAGSSAAVSAAAWTHSEAATRTAVDLGSALLSAVILTPVITVIDKAVTQGTAGTASISEALRAGFKSFASAPLRFMFRREARLIFGVYAATYATANLATSTSVSKLATVTPVNMAACIWKDRAFAAMFGTRAPTALPFLCYGLFASRDALTVAASFNGPQVVNSAVKKHKVNMSPTAVHLAANLSLPVAVQLVSTPVHVLALDLYNRKKASFAERMVLVRTMYVQTTVTRMMRILPAFGVGTMLTSHVRAGALRRLGLGHHV